MTARHGGTYQYWKPSRKISRERWSRIAWVIALSLTLTVFAYVIVATYVMLMNLPPEVPQ